MRTTWHRIAYLCKWKPSPHKDYFKASAMENTNNGGKDLPANDKVLLNVTDWQHLHIYQKSDVLYQLTFIFCQRFLPHYGDRTVDQMVQAARSGKQNIVEGSEDGMTSTEMELKLMNVARSSFKELREDYQDYLNSRGLSLWNRRHPRYNNMLAYCRTHNVFADYKPYVQRWTAEEFCNVALTLCHITDKMMCSYLKWMEKSFVQKGGIKERMYAARTGYRRQQDELLSKYKQENEALKQKCSAYEHEIECLKAEMAKITNKASDTSDTSDTRRTSATSSPSFQ